MTRPAAFLDRDGTLIEDVGYLSAVDQVKFLPGAMEAVRLLNDAGFFVAVVTNQSGVARGYFPEALVNATHDAIQASLAKEAARIDAFYFCPHFRAGAVAEFVRECDCRKPLAGMFHRAEREHGPFSRPSFMFGDRDADMGFAQAAGLEPCFIGEAAGTGIPEATRWPSLLAAVQHAIAST
jgi:D-glycero-D-manno-heptose 1,7-bisphosphate phosphatase